MNMTKPNRRSFLKAMLAAGAAPWMVPAQVLGADGGTAPSNRINVGVIGVGEQGRGDMINFLGQDDVRITAICDVNQRNLARARDQIAEAYGSPDVNVYSDFRELNADPSIDAVLMALPVHWHSAPSLDAIRHGKHIYHEKPMALSFEEGRLIREAVLETGVVFQFGTQQRSDLKFRWACELALNGRLGTLQEIQVSVPGGRIGPAFPDQPVPDFVDWDRWVGPAPAMPFHNEKLKRDNHENITNFSLGMISCWGIHHLDIAQWGNCTDDSGPTRIEGTGIFPEEGDLDAIQRWRVRFEFDRAAPVTFVSDGTEGFRHGVRFVGDSGWVHVQRGSIEAAEETVLRDPQNKYGTMPVALRVSVNHTRDFLDAIRNGSRAICDADTAMRSDTLCQLALIAVQEGRSLRWNPREEQFEKDDAANARLRPRAVREGFGVP